MDMDARSRSVASGSSPRMQLDARALHNQAQDRFARVGIATCHLDRAVLECLIAATSRSIENPLGYCIAVGRRLQDEADRCAGRMQRAQRFWIENACPHGVVDVRVCPKCAEDCQRALELFPFLRRFLSDSPDLPALSRGRT